MGFGESFSTRRQAATRREFYGFGVLRCVFLWNETSLTHHMESRNSPETPYIVVWIFRIGPNLFYVGGKCGSMPVSATETSHNRRANSAFWAILDLCAEPEAPRISRQPCEPK